MISEDSRFQLIIRPESRFQLLIRPESRFQRFIALEPGFQRFIALEPGFPGISIFPRISRKSVSNLIDMESGFHVYKGRPFGRPL